MCKKSYFLKLHLKNHVSYSNGNGRSRNRDNCEKINVILRKNNERLRIEKKKNVSNIHIDTWEQEVVLEVKHPLFMRFITNLLSKILTVIN